MAPPPPDLREASGGGVTATRQAALGSRGVGCGSHGRVRLEIPENSGLPLHFFFMLLFFLFSLFFTLLANRLLANPFLANRLLANRLAADLLRLFFSVPVNTGYLSPD